MARKFDIQLKQWLPLVIESFFTYETLNTFEIIKHSGRPLVILGGEGQVKEILSVLNFLVESKLLIPRDKESAHYFDVTFDSFSYDVSENFKNLIEESLTKGKQPNSDDWIEEIKVENATHNTINVFNFNFTFALEKLIEFKAGLLNL